MPIHLATEFDLPAIENIYNQAIRRKFCTADMQPLGMEKRRLWLQAHDPLQYPVFVYEEGSDISGWVSLSAYRPGREALRDVVEVSYYVDERWQGQGVASRLLEFAIQASRQLGKRVIFAIIIEGNQASIHLAEKFGFQQWGYLPKVVLCDGETRGHIYMGRLLEAEQNDG